MKNSNIVIILFIAVQGWLKRQINVIEVHKVLLIKFTTNIIEKESTN